MEIKVVENVLKLNDEVAQLNRATLQGHHVACIDLIGAPGCGKTALLERTLRSLTQEMTIGVLAGDLATTRDAERLVDCTPHVAQINTGKGCHLDANQVRQGMSNLELESLDLLIIENVGNLICPVGFDLGQTVKVGMFSTTEGDDKPAKHPYVVLASDLIILNKLDLLPYVPFSVERFEDDLRSVRSDVSLLQMTAISTESKSDQFDLWLEWIRNCVQSTNAGVSTTLPANSV